MSRIGAIDQGTTSTRILVAEGDRFEIAASFAHATQHPAPGRVEQDARELLANVRRCIAAAGPLDALGLANQGESCLAWDALSGEPLSPVIVWQDSRAAEELRKFRADQAAEITSRSALPLDAYFSASKLGWIMRHVPAARAAHAAGRLHLGTSDAFLIEQLTGHFATDRATASRTSLMNFRTGEWDAELCALFGVPRDALPEIRPSISDFGRVDGVPLSAAIVDQQAALYGHGCRKPGDAKITFGTGAFALALSDGPVAPTSAGGLLPTMAWDLGDGPVYALDGGVYDVGSAIDWAIRAGLADGVGDFQRFDAPAAIDRGLVFVPAFSGLAAPEWDRSAAPLLIGFGADSSKRDFCQALLEGIALATADVMTAMGSAVPLSPSLSIDGGVSRSPYFVQFLTDSLGRDVRPLAFTERTALGVATLAAQGIGRELNGPEEAGSTVTPTISADQRATRQARFAQARRLSRGWRS